MEVSPLHFTFALRECEYFRIPLLHFLRVRNGTLFRTMRMTAQLLFPSVAGTVIKNV